MSKITDVLEIIKGMTVLELAETVKAFEEEFGVSAAAPVAAVAAAPAAAPVAAAEEEQTEFDIVLTSAGQAKINVIKVVKDIAGVGLKEAKELVDSAPKAIKEKVTREEAEAVKAKLEEAGASAEIK
jgi:large subunit ribosomal protein L7/L12